MAVYLYNRLLYSAINKTLYKALIGIKLNLANIRVFGAKTLKIEPNITKLDNRTSEWKLIGYGHN